MLDDKCDLTGTRVGDESAGSCWLVMENKNNDQVQSTVKYPRGYRVLCIAAVVVLVITV